MRRRRRSRHRVPSVCAEPVRGAFVAADMRHQLHRDSRGGEVHSTGPPRPDTLTAWSSSKGDSGSSAMRQRQGSPAYRPGTSHAFRKRRLPYRPPNGTSAARCVENDPHRPSQRYGAVVAQRATHFTGCLCFCRLRHHVRGHRADLVDRAGDHLIHQPCRHHAARICVHQRYQLCLTLPIRQDLRARRGYLCADAALHLRAAHQHGRNATPAACDSRRMPLGTWDA